MSRNCKNHNCVRHDPKSEHYGCTLGPDCYGCPKYTDTPPPKPFTPKNPDDYLPGCRIGSERPRFKRCDDCSYAMGRCKTTMHYVACECTYCYDPAPKPKTKDYAVIKFEISQDEHNMEDMLMALREQRWSPISGEIITEEEP